MEQTYLFVSLHLNVVDGVEVGFTQGQHLRFCVQYLRGKTR